jgi:hypothetical protein
VDYHEIPIYVTNFNNLDRGFRRLLAWLREAGHENVTVIDNGSTWPPLEEFYRDTPELMVVRLTENKGPYAFWHLGAHLKQETPFVVTDPDLVPSVTCPRDLVGRMLKAMGELPATPCKVGPSLRVDNLPSCYRHHLEVKGWEEQFWQRSVSDESGRLVAYDAQIDTTMALYAPGSDSWPQVGTHYRLAPPYTVEHVPWYEDSASPSEEAIFYARAIDRQWTHWSKL